MIKPLKKFGTNSTSKKSFSWKKPGKRFTADEWLTANFEKVIDKYAGRYIIVVDNKGIVFTDRDGSPRELALRAKKEYPGLPLFFRVPRPKDFMCVLNSK